MVRSISKAVVILATLLGCHAFKQTRSFLLTKQERRSATLTMAARDHFGMLPLCLEPTSKSTVINDPTAGMTPEQIQEYVSNVGGAMCGYPDSIRSIIGVSLNLSLLLFGFFTVGYVILGGLNFFYEKGVEDTLQDVDRRFGLNFSMARSSAGAGAARSMVDAKPGSSTVYTPGGGGDSLKLRATLDDEQDKGQSLSGLNRSERRMKGRIDKEAKKKP